MTERKVNTISKDYHFSEMEEQNKEMNQSAVKDAMNAVKDDVLEPKCVRDGSIKQPNSKEMSEAEKLRDIVHDIKHCNIEDSFCIELIQKEIDRQLQQYKDGLVKELYGLQEDVREKELISTLIHYLSGIQKAIKLIEG